MESIITDVNQFTDTFHELVILTLTMDHNLDKPGYPHLSMEEYQLLFRQIIDSLHHLYLVKDPSVKDLMQDLSLLPLNQLIGQEACVIVLVDCPMEYVSTYFQAGKTSLSLHYSRLITASF
jgi:hypothetical protein